MTTTAERNRALKSIMSKAFAPHKVTVRGSRGTAYGWVRLHIAYSPRNRREAQELRQQVWQVIRDNKISIDFTAMTIPAATTATAQRSTSISTPGASKPTPTISRTPGATT